jgi:CubicO group peptidase (beta-lactamase class C family)
MAQDALSEFVTATATRFGIPGVAVGVWADGREVYACHGVTSVDNPLPVDRDTLYLLGSVTKTYTATTLLRLVADGRVELDAPVHRYVPELRLTDERAAAQVTVLHLLNHTAGLDWGLIADFGEGDDALAGYVARMAELGLVARPGERASYSQAGYNLAGRIVEKVTGLTFERAVASLVFEPLGLQHSFFARDDVMTRRFAVGHNRGEDGTLSIAWLWRRSRGDNPGGGIVSSAADQLRWARFHLGDGRAPAVPVSFQPNCCSGCSSRRSRCGPARSETPSASPGSCARWTASGPSGTVGRPTASSPSCSPCRSATSPWWRCPTPAPTAPTATRPSCVGRCRPTWG